jgi:hypothetical protein
MKGFIMKYSIIILFLMLNVCLAQNSTSNQAIFINKSQKVMITQDGGKSWSEIEKVSNKVDNNTCKTAIFIKNGKRLTSDGGKTWSLSTENLKQGERGDFKIFPNPVNGNIINISIPGKDDEKILNLYIYDLLGNKKLEFDRQNLNQGTMGLIQISVDNLPSGNYQLVLRTENNSFYSLIMLIN